MQKNILLISPNLYANYKNKIKIAINFLPSLTLAVLAAPLLKHNIKIIDMSLNPSYGSLIRNLQEHKPHYICITSLTPSFDEAKKIIKLAKQYTSAKIILGGPHTSSFPESCLKESEADMVVKGEGDITLKEIIEEKPLNKINGLYYKWHNQIIKNSDRCYIQDLDTLPHPAWHLFDIKKYKSPKLLSKKSPVGPIETSRGCIYECTYCNKNIFGKTFRVKSPIRVLEEMKYMSDIGFKEIHVNDDGFSTDMARGKKICRLLIKEKLDLPWVLTNGIRIDRVDEELMSLLKKSGCYRVAYGIESGNQTILNNIKKGIKLEHIRKAVKLAKKCGIETQGFFMIGLPGDTEETMQQTIDFAKSLDLDTAKVGITMPLPGTQLYKELEQQGAIKTKNLSLISQQAQQEIYKHPNLDWEIIQKYYSEFYKQTLYSPSFIFKRFKKGLFTGQIFWDCYYFVKTMGKSF